MSETILQSADLFYCGGGSDKEYHAQLVGVSGGGCVVRFQYGRRGSTLTSGTKTATPVPQVSAQKIYDKLVAEKTGKGYQVGAGQGVSIVPTAVSSSVIFIPQLLNPIDESEVERYLKDDRWAAQEKYDGRHQTLHVVRGKLTVANRKGKEIGYPKVWGQDIRSMDVILDGEAIGDRFYAFDLLSALGEDYRGRGYEERWELLTKMEYKGSIEVVPLAVGYAAKKALYDRLVKEGREGIVFKNRGGIYCPGKSHTDMCKHKFYATASVRVCAGRSGKHSVGLEILDGSRWVGVGNVTVGQSTALPPVGSVIEIRYLYAYPGGSLYQPSYLGPRDDVDEGECVIGQLKYKSEE